MAARAVAWLALASPNEQATIASAWSPLATPSRLARARLKAMPIAFGRWLAMVLVCGGTHSARLPHTLWRPPLIGSSAEATTPSSVSSIGVLPGAFRARASMKPPDR